MSTTLEQNNGHILNHNSTASLDDTQWLKSLNFRRSANAELSKAAESGDVEAFTSALPMGLISKRTRKKAQIKQLLSDLSNLRESNLASPSSSELAQILQDGSLNAAERSVRVEAFIAEHTDVAPESVMLTDALWVLQLKAKSLEPTALFALWRWTLQRGQEWISAQPQCDAEQGFSSLRFLEVCYLLAMTFSDLKGSRKLLKETQRLIAGCVDSATDTDGTPQPQWIPDIADTLSCLGRTALFADVQGESFLKAEASQRISALLGRSLTFCTRWHVSFGSSDAVVDFGRWEAICGALGTDIESGPIKLLRAWRESKSQKIETKNWTLPKANHQSDWAMVSVMRSSWNSPADQCTVTYDAATPQLDVVVRDTPLFQGNWAHQLKVNGEEVSSDEKWTSSCWFSDKEVAYLELTQDAAPQVKNSRQIILLRQEQLLIVNHSVVADDDDNIELQVMLPLRGAWTAQQDSATRELALEKENQQVRVYPTSLPQHVVTKATGQVQATSDVLTQSEQGTARVCMSTIVDWSAQRKSKPVEWTQLSVAQNGQLEPRDQAIAYRLRIQKEHWLFYHSLAGPEIPRTVLGVHTPHETVLGRLSAKGEMTPIIEVEM